MLEDALYFLKQNFNKVAAYQSAICMSRRLDDRLTLLARTLTLPSECATAASGVEL